MEDLVACGYRNTDRKIGLGMIHYRHVLTKVAKWHASTAVLESMVMYTKKTRFHESKNKQFKYL